MNWEILLNLLQMVVSIFPKYLWSEISLQQTEKQKEIHITNDIKKNQTQFLKKRSLHII